jgi:selenocysteine-specific elongation factor
MHVIGTAGHVDHGKSTLVTALTGINPDRLKEEQDRSMTIDLGFAWLDLPGGETVGVVDVPGHRDFIENMLAGVGGIDLVLFVIAGDEGVMPQTREHLAVVDLLGIQAGVIALTKIDMVTEPGWLEEVEADIHRLTAGTVLEDAPICRVSARTGQGLSQLVDAIRVGLAAIPPRQDRGRPRLPVDRVFTMTGFGTVVTGTLLDGSLALSDDVLIQPGGLRARIRGLQTHHQKMQSAGPGTRTALNLTGVDYQAVHRGDVVTLAGMYEPSTRLDARVRLLADSHSGLRHHDQVKIFHGTAESMAYVRVLGGEEILPGEEGWVQLECEMPLCVSRLDRFILRRPSPAETIGGGVIVRPVSAGRYRRNDPRMLEELRAELEGSPLDRFLEKLKHSTPAELIAGGEYSHDQAEAYLRQLLAEHRARQVGSFWFEQAEYDSLVAKVKSIFEKTVRESPLWSGMKVEELRSRLGLASAVFSALLEGWQADGWLEVRQGRISPAGYLVTYSLGQSDRINQLLEQFDRNPTTPPSRKQCVELVGEDVYRSLLETGRLRQVSEDVVFREQDFLRLRAEILTALADGRTISLAEVRDRLGTTRRYVQALLEYLDKLGDTIREGEVRRLKIK